MNSMLRNWARKSGLLRWLNPLVSWVERRRIAAICDYSAEVAPSEVVFSFDGTRIAMPTSHEHFQSMARSNHERPTTAVFLQYIKAGETVWDIGANAGYYSWMASNLVGKNGRVISFEPNPSNFQMLVANVRMLPLTNIEPTQLAISDHEGKAHMEKADRVTPESRLMLDEKSPPADAVEVSVVSGDILVAKHHFPIPAFIKVDVEGYEMEVLRGMKAVLASPSCQKILCEVHFALLAKRGMSKAVKEMIRLLRESGFSKLSWVSRSHLLARK